MSKPIIIKLHFERKFFEEIYFTNHQGDYMRSPTTKVAFRILVVFGIFALASFIYALIFEATALSTTIIILFVLALIYYLDKCHRLYSWKNEINTFLDSEEKVLKNTIVLTDTTFSLVQDDKETIEHWANFTHVHISDQYVSLSGKENYIIPSKSASRANYSLIKEMISKWIK